jgi:hypothetical protein
MPSVGTNSIVLPPENVAANQRCRLTDRCAASNPTRFAAREEITAASVASYEPSTVTSSSPGHSCGVPLASETAVTYRKSVTNIRRFAVSTAMADVPVKLVR